MVPISCSNDISMINISSISTNVRTEFAPSLLLTNTMSLAPKIDEVNFFIMENNVDLAFITETWLTDLVSDNYLHISGYFLICKNRSLGTHGGVCLYIKNSIKV